MRKLLVVMGLLLSVSCSTSQQGQSLEAKAKAGDPASACQLVVEDLYACLAARKDWMDRPSQAQPMRQKNAVPDEHHAHLVSALDALSGDPKRANAGKLVLDGVSMVETALSNR